MSECQEIQRRLNSSKKKTEASSRGFTRLMLEGRVRQALKLVNADSDVSGVHSLNDDIRRTLQEKHPQGEPPQEEVMSEADIPRVEEVIFEELDSSMIQVAAKDTAGAGGPTKIDAIHSLFIPQAHTSMGRLITDCTVVIGRRDGFSERLGSFPRFAKKRGGRRSKPGCRKRTNAHTHAFTKK